MVKKEKQKKKKKEMIALDDMIWTCIDCIEPADLDYGDFVYMCDKEDCPSCKEVQNGS